MDLKYRNFAVSPRIKIKRYFRLDTGELFINESLLEDPTLLSSPKRNQTKDDIMFVEQKKPKDFDCGYNLDRMIASLPRIEDEEERIEYAERAVGLIKQSHPNWVDENGESPEAWDHFFQLADYDPNDYGIYNPHNSQTAEKGQ